MGVAFVSDSFYVGWYYFFSALAFIMRNNYGHDGWVFGCRARVGFVAEQGRTLKA
jgi:hypothetical protein